MATTHQVNFGKMFAQPLTALSRWGYRGICRVGIIVLLLALCTALQAVQLNPVPEAAAAAPEPSTNYLLLFVVALLLHAPIVVGVFLGFCVLVHATIEQRQTFMEGTVYPQYCLLCRR